MPPDLRDWLPEDHLVYTVSELVDALDLAAFYAPYAQQGSGNLPSAPAMMVKILVYGYATGVLSSRRLAQKLEEDVVFRVLVAVVQLAGDLGLVSLATLVPDSTKVRAHASKRKAMSYGRMQQQEARARADTQADTLAATPMETPAEPSVTPEPQTQSNFTDPESRIMQTS